MTELRRIARALATFDDAGLDGELVASARAALERSPERFFPLASETDAALRLEAVVSVRLSIVHAELNPREVGAERARRACVVVRALEAREHSLALDPALSDEDRLRYETLRFFHPTPRFADPSAGTSVARSTALAQLLARWEARPEAEVPLLTWFGRKARQHAMFYRFGFGIPLYAARATRMRKRLPATLATHPGIRETYRAIEQLGPVLDNFVFDRPLTAAFVDHVVVADFAFLYMQLADELVDNLARLGGERALRALLDGEDPASIALAPLEELDASRLSAAGIDPLAPIVKYGLTLLELVERLRALHGALADALRACPDVVARRAEVRAFFHHCFATFLDELELARLSGQPRLDAIPYEDVAWHFHRKNDVVMTRFMALRAHLLGLDPRSWSRPLRRFGALLASFQIFDDMKDVGVDLGHQPCYPLFLARSADDGDLGRLEGRLVGMELALDRNEVPELGVLAARTMRDCLRWARLLARYRFDWFVRYVADTRWRRNWLVRNGSFHRPAVDRSIERSALAHSRIETGVPSLDALFRALAVVGPRLANGRCDEGVVSYAIDLVGYDHGGALFLAALPDVGFAYRFVNLRMTLTEAERTRLAARLAARHPHASALGLAGLRAETSADFAAAAARLLGRPLPALGHAGSLQRSPMVGDAG